VSTKPKPHLPASYSTRLQQQKTPHHLSLPSATLELVSLATVSALASLVNHHYWLEIGACYPNFSAFFKWASTSSLSNALNLYKI
jgi:hypothetical protein